MSRLYCVAVREAPAISFTDRMLAGFDGGRPLWKGTIRDILPTQTTGRLNVDEIDNECFVQRRDIGANTVRTNHRYNCYLTSTCTQGAD